MRRFFVTSIGLMLAVGAASANCLGAVFDFTGSSSTAFLDPTNWTPAGAFITPDSDQYIINHGLTSAYSTNVVQSVGSLIVGGEQSKILLGTDGTFNMSTGSLTDSGGGDSFQVARDLGGKGLMNLTGNAQFTAGAGSADCCTIGARDQGVLNITDNAVVTSPNTYWRVGNYGPQIDDGLGPLQGNGLINVSGHGQFNGMFMFIGVTGGKGELRVSDHGSVNLTGGDLIPNVNTNLPTRSALVHIIGSNATLNAQNDQSANGPLETHNQYLFEADSGGVSPIKLVDAVNIDNNDLTVNLGSFVVLPGSPLNLFEEAPNRRFGTFANVTVTGGNAAATHLHYNDALGAIQLVVPEPSTMLLMGIGMSMMAFVTKRRAAR